MASTRASVTVKCPKNASRAVTLGPWFGILRFFGIFPISKYGKFSMPRWYRSVAVTILLTVFILPVEVYDYLSLLPKRQKQEPFRVLQATMSTAHKFGSFVLLVFHITAMRKYKQELETVCQHLIKYRHRKVDKLTFMVIVWAVTSHTVFTYYRTSMANFATFAKIANYIRTRLIFILFLLTRIFLAHMYSTLLHYLTQLFKKSTNEAKKNPLNAILCHARLLELTKSIHLCFSVQLLLLFTFCTYTVIIDTYFIATLFVSNTRDNNFNKISERVFSFGSLLYYSMFPTSRCEKLTKVAEAFNNELFKLMRDSKDLCSNSKLRLYVTMKQTVNFTACGFFSLGYPLVTSIIAAATTYLVILIQFSLLTS